MGSIRAGYSGHWACASIRAESRAESRAEPDYFHSGTLTCMGHAGSMFCTLALSESEHWQHWKGQA